MAPIDSSEEQRRVLDLLPEAMARHPGLTRAAVRRWCGIAKRTFEAYYAGQGPDVAAYERLIDFIRGRVAPRKVGDLKWEFDAVPAEAWREAYQQLARRVDQAATELRALTQGAPPDVPLPYVAEKSTEGLTSNGNAATVPDMETANANRYEGETSKLEPFRLYPTQKRLLVKAAKTRGLGYSEWVREAVDEKLRREGLSMPNDR